MSDTDTVTITKAAQQRTIETLTFADTVIRARDAALADLRAELLGVRKEYVATASKAMVALQVAGAEIVRLSGELKKARNLPSPVAEKSVVLEAAMQQVAAAITTIAQQGAPIVNVASPEVHVENILPDRPPMKQTIHRDGHGYIEFVTEEPMRDDNA